MTPTLRQRAEHAARYGANLVVPAVELKQLLDQVDAVRALHTADTDGDCAHCTSGCVYPIPAPCPTMTALAEAETL